MKIISHAECKLRPQNQISTQPSIGCLVQTSFGKSGCENEESSRSSKCRLLTSTVLVIASKPRNEQSSVKTKIINGIQLNKQNHTK